MLAIRLARFGAKKKPAYRVVVTEKSRARDSKSLETLGHYNPTKDPIVLSLNEERIRYWIGQGAQPSETVRRLMTLKPEDVVTTEQRPRIELAPRAAAPPATDEQPAATAEAPPTTDEQPAAEQSGTQAEVPAEETGGTQAEAEQGGPSDSQAEVEAEEVSPSATEARPSTDSIPAEEKPSEDKEAAAEEKPDSETEPTS